MCLSRRRILTIAAATAVAGPLPVAAETLWQGHAFGAEASIVLRGPHGATGPALAEALDTLRRIESAFSLHHPESELARLNRDGGQSPLSADMRALLAAADRLYRATDGLFDPTVQSLWTGLAAAPGWEKVDRAPQAVTLAPGQRLTFNGIAQGFATDAVSAVLARHGFCVTLVNIGERRGRGGPWRVGIDDPNRGRIGFATVSDGAISTSSPGAIRLADGGAQNVDPRDPSRKALWSSVTVEAADATSADGMSTALCFADTGTMRGAIAALPGLRRVIAVSADGGMITIRG